MNLTHVQYTLLHELITCWTFGTYIIYVVSLSAVYVGRGLVFVVVCSKNKVKSDLFLTQPNSQGFVFLHKFLKLIPELGGTFGALNGIWPCMVLYGLGWSYAAMHNLCACFCQIQV